jgi:ornithine carbamoyltransferase
VPVVNGFSHGHNPCEALAELATLEARLGSLNGLRLAYLGQACNVTHDLMAAAGLAGVHLTVATTDGSQPDPA